MDCIHQCAVLVSFFKIALELERFQKGKDDPKQQL